MLLWFAGHHVIGWLGLLCVGPIAVGNCNLPIRISRRYGDAPCDVHNQPVNGMLVALESKFLWLARLYSRSKYWRSSFEAQRFGDEFVMYWIGLISHALLSYVDDSV